jgi:hypothetical protein
MRVLYLIAGILLGVYFTSKVAIKTTDEINYWWEKNITAYTLTAFHEGWSRGRYYTTKQIYWFYQDCQDELDRAYRRMK